MCVLNSVDATAEIKMCPLQEITATLIISTLKIKTIILTSTTKKNYIYWKPYISSSSLSSRGRRRVFEFSIREDGGAVDSAGLERTTRAGFRFRRGFSGRPKRSCPGEFRLFSCSHNHLTGVGMGDLEGAPVVQGHPKGLLGHSTPSTRRRRRRKSRTGRKEGDNARRTRWMGEEEGEMKKK